MLDRNSRWDWWNDPRERRYEEGFKLLLEEHKTMGRYPTFEEMKAKYGLMVYTLIQHSGSFEQACEDASLYAYRLKQRAAEKARDSGLKIEQLKPARGLSTGYMSHLKELDKIPSPQKTDQKGKK